MSLAPTERKLEVSEGTCHEHSESNCAPYIADYMGAFKRVLVNEDTCSRLGTERQGQQNRRPSGRGGESSSGPLALKKPTTKPPPQEQRQLLL